MGLRFRRFSFVRFVPVPVTGKNINLVIGHLARFLWNTEKIVTRYKLKKLHL